MAEKPTVLVNEDRNPPKIATAKPTMITQLKAQGYRVVDEDPPGPYEGLKKAQLQEEIDRRNETRADDEQLPRSGTVAELVDTLTTDDTDKVGQ